VGQPVAAQLFWRAEPPVAVPYPTEVIMTDPSSPVARHATMSGRYLAGLAARLADRHRKETAAVAVARGHADQLRAQLAQRDTQLAECQLQATCRDLIRGFAKRGEADLVTEYASVIPMLAVSSLFGISTEHGHQLRAGLIALFGSGEDSQEGNRTFERILSRLITRTAVTTALTELHDLTLAILPDEIELLPSPWTRCPANLPVRFVASDVPIVEQEVSHG
jgi:hypothetical protein